MSGIGFQTPDEYATKLRQLIRDIRLFFADVPEARAATNRDELAKFGLRVGGTRWQLRVALAIAKKAKISS